MSEAPSSSAPDTAAAAHAQLVQMILGVVAVRAMYALAELAVPDLLVDGPRTADEMARATDTQPAAMHRLLRTSAGLGFLEQTGDGRFGLTPTGSALRSDSPYCSRSMVRVMAGPLGWGTLGETMHSLKTGESAVRKALGTPIFEYLAGSPDEATRFNELMIAFHGAEPAAVAAAYDFSGVERVVDVGGGTGNLLTTILLANPTLRGVIYDLPHVAGQARALVAERGLSDRCEVMEGSFFDAVPSGGDAYLLSHVVHDWDDATCLRVLGHCRDAMREGDRLLLVEMVLPEGGEFHPGKILDHVMLAFTEGGRERTAAEYATLLEGASLKLSRVVPTASPVSVVQAGLA